MFSLTKNDEDLISTHPTTDLKGSDAAELLQHEELIEETSEESDVVETFLHEELTNEEDCSARSDDVKEDRVHLHKELIKEERESPEESYTSGEIPAQLTNPP